MNLDKMCLEVVRHALVCVRSLAIACNADVISLQGNADPRIEQCQLISGPRGFRSGESGLDALFPNFRPRSQLPLQKICLDD